MDSEEFYVASNPPLTPSGVKEVVDQLGLMQLERCINIYEVIYDPEVPWFRFLATKGAREEITKFMQGVLIKIGEEDATSVDKDENSSHADIEAGEESRLQPWVPGNSTAVSDEYDTFRFPKFRADTESDQDPTDLICLDINPEPKPEPSFKAVWRGLEENWPRFTNVEQFLDCLDLPPVPNRGLSSLERLQGHFDVEISWNLRATILYIASYKGTDEVETTIKMLDQAIRNQLGQYHTRDQLEENKEEDVVEEVFW